MYPVGFPTDRYGLVSGGSGEYPMKPSPCSPFTVIFFAFEVHYDHRFFFFGDGHPLLCAGTYLLGTLYAATWTDFGLFAMLACSGGEGIKVMLAHHFSHGGFWFR